MVATISVVAPLLLLLALPGYLSDHQQANGTLVVASWWVATGMVLTIPVALVRRGTSGWGWLWISIGCFIALLLLEPFNLHRPLGSGSTPWLLALSYVATSCVAVALRNPLVAGALCGGLVVAVTVVYVEELSPTHSAINSVGLALASAIFIVTIRLRRLQADRVDASERRVERLYDAQRQELTVDEERVRTDALLHDSVLASLLAAASPSPAQSVSMAHSALAALGDTGHFMSHPSRLHVVDAFSDLAVAGDLVDATVSLDGANGVYLPTDVAEALVSATGQALANSVKHAGAGATYRTVTAAAREGVGVRITVSDDGQGFDASRIPPERLGVRVSILGQMERVGGTATLLTAPGQGTSIILEWIPDHADLRKGHHSFGRRVKLIPRRQLTRLLTAFICLAVLTAVSEAALHTRALGPVIAATLGLMVLPALLRGATSGAMRARTAWGMAGVGVLLCCTATIGLDPAKVDAVSIYWYTCGILAGAIMVWMAGHHAPPLVAVAALATQITLWAGPTGTIRLGLAAEIILIIAGVMMYRTIGAVTSAADAAAEKHRRLSDWRHQRDAYVTERLHRLQRARTSAGPMLERIILSDGHLTESEQHECRVLEQGLRDEIRGRHLLNDQIRRAAAWHRRRGAHVQVLDDGGLDDFSPAQHSALLDEIAACFEPLRASRIVIRTGSPDSDIAATLVATTPDETAVALGLDSDDDVELWKVFLRADQAERPSAVAQAHWST